MAGALHRDLLSGLHLVTPPTIASLGIKKSFDMVEWLYIWEVLWWMGFLLCYLDWLKTVYSIPMAFLHLSSLLSAPFSATAGCQAGLPPLSDTFHCSHGTSCRYPPGLYGNSEFKSGLVEEEGSPLWQRLLIVPERCGPLST